MSRTTRYASFHVGAIGLSLCLGCASVTGSAEAKLDPKKRMTVEEAQALVYQIFTPDPHHEVALEPFEMRYSPEFYGFEALRANPGGSDHIGSYLVNPWNGEVWDDDDPCHLVETPGLKKLQIEIRKRLRLTKAELAKAHTLKPFCYEGPE